MSHPDSVSASGEGSTAAGRDINYYSLYPDDINLSKKFNSINENVNNTIGRLRSGRTGNREIEFDAEKLFLSLSLVGIPPAIILIVLDRLVPFIKEELSVSKEEFSTKHIRLAVSKTILVLDISSGVTDRRHEWASRYARKFGNPNQPIMVKHKDNSQEPLNYKFLNNELVPHVIKRILEISDESVDIHRFISGISIREMSEQILEHIRRMDLYYIKYTTLLSVAEELAVQPPHPWFVTRDGYEETVAYDMDRSKAHIQRIDDAVKDNSSFWQVAGELAHHLSSAVLSHYRYFLGSSYLSPLYNLRNVLQIITNDENVSLWSFCAINRIEGDLHSIDKVVGDLYQITKKIEKQIHARNHESIDAVKKLCISFYDIAYNLIYKSNDFEKFVHKIEYKNVSFNNIEDALIRLDNSEVVSVDSELSFIRVRINRDAKLSDMVKPIIIFIHGSTIDNSENNIRLVLEKIPKRYTDTIFICDLHCNQEHDNFKICKIDSKEFIKKIFECNGQQYLLNELLSGA